MSGSHDTGGAGQYDADRLDALADAIAPQFAELSRSMARLGITGASQADLLRSISGAAAGSIPNPYMLGRDRGLTRQEARNGAPTAAYLAIAEYLVGHMGSEAPEQLRKLFEL